MHTSAQTNQPSNGVNLSPPARLKCSMQEVWVCCCLALVTAALYSPVRHHQFVYLDDKEYVTENPHLQSGVTSSGVVWAFAHSYAGNWHPLTWVSHALDCQIWGLNPMGHHLTNVVFHVANSVLLFLVLSRMTGACWRSALVAALFAWHPLQVESVAWISERKNVLSTFFCFLAFASYLGYVRRPRWPQYLLVLLCFALGLMAKPMLVTLPFVLLLLDFWPLQRLRFVTLGSLWPALRPLLWEKVPLFLLAAASSLITYLVQKNAGALYSFQQVSVSLRLCNALVSYAAYIGDLFWPAGLAVFYPFRVVPNLWQVAGSVLFLLAATGFVLRQWRQYPFLAVGWFWFCGTLVPVIGLVQTGGQAMADRYAYLPFIGLFIILAWGLPVLLPRWPVWRWLVPAGAVGGLAACLMVTSQQLHYWTDNKALFERALAVTSNNAFAHLNLSESLRDEGDLDGAASHQREALRLNPGYKEAHHNLGVVLLLQGKVDEGIEQFQEALQIYPDYAIAHSNLAEALMGQGKVAPAIYHCQAALRLKPDLAEAQNNLAWLRATQPDRRYRDGAEALRLAQSAVLRTGGKNPSMLDTLAAAQAETGRFEEAVQTAEQAHLLALSLNQLRMAAGIAEHRELFRHHQPYRTAE
jgi:protein O-mannosyl-transferase